VAEDCLNVRGRKLSSGHYCAISDCLVRRLHRAIGEWKTHTPALFISHTRQRVFGIFIRLSCAGRFHARYNEITRCLLQLVPLTGWLPVPLPSQIRCMTVPGGAITQFEVSPCKQYLILAKKTGDPQLWHIMSNTLVGTFKGKGG
jgi:hypothetical protein